MSRSKPTDYEIAEAWAHQYERTLTLRDFNGSVLLVDDEGCVLFWQWACYAAASPQFYAIFTEHHGVHLHALDDVLTIKFFPNPHRRLPQAKFRTFMRAVAQLKRRRSSP
jgi:hypothetical protein